MFGNMPFLTFHLSCRQYILSTFQETCATRSGKGTCIYKQQFWILDTNNHLTDSPEIRTW